MGCAMLKHNVRSIAREASAAPAAKFKWHCPAFLLKPGKRVPRIIVSLGMHSFRSQQVAAQDLFTLNGIHAARKTAQIAS